MQESPSRKTSWASFTALNMCQFIGSMNDNLYKLLLVYCFIHLEGAKESTSILAFAGGLYVLPFLFLATTAGILADRHSKRTIIIATRVVEVVALLVGVIAFSLQSKFLAYVVLFLLACHSSLFAPSKYGIVPELVDKQDLSKANGLLTLFTYTAIIIGTFLASFLTEITGYNFILAALVPLLFSLLSLSIAFFIQKTPPSGSHKKVSVNILRQLLLNLRVIRKKPPLLTAVLGSAFFLLFGSFVQLNIIPFALKCLHLSEVQGGYMFLLTALGIGIGSFLAGKFSGNAIELGLVTFGGLGLALSFFLLWLFSSHVPTVLCLFALIGIFGGLYLVPLDSYIQMASPATARGQVVATSNFFGFSGVLLSALLLYITSDLWGMAPDAAFLLMGGLVLASLFFLFFSFSEEIIRFYSFLLSAFAFPTFLQGKHQIPLDRSSFFFAPHSLRAYIPALLGSQRNRIKIFSVGRDDPPSFLTRSFRKLVPIIPIHRIEEAYPPGKQASFIKKSVQQGYSIAFFASKKELSEHTYSLKNAWKATLPQQDLSFFVVDIARQWVGKKNVLPLTAQCTKIE